MPDAAAGVPHRWRPDWRLWPIAAGCLLFAVIAFDVSRGGQNLSALDRGLTLWFNTNADPALTRWLLVLTNAHTPWAVCGWGALFAMVLARRKEPDWLLTLAVVLPGGMLLNLLLKQIFQRARPVLDEPLLTLGTFSFPSGHVVASTLFYGLLAAYLAARRTTDGARAVFVSAAVLAVLLVAMTRVYLGVHHASDTLAAAAWSTAWLLGWLAVLRPAATAR